VIKHNRYSAGGFSFFDAARLSTDDVVLVTLPIYHANGAIIGVGASLVSGATVVMRKKFSASNFWKDCIQYKCTAFIYVGEICRFLVNQPASPLDRAHGVRKAIGNGLRSNVWKDFHARFNIRCIEFYAASEGNCTMVNLTSKIGACGFLPLVNRLVNLLPVYLVRIDDEMNLIRDKSGFCIPCRPGERGLLVGIIGNRAKTAYNGYANNAKESSKKIIENVFRKGQRAFNSGDSLIMDKYGYMYFCDRLGDTYRWRGENVATIEVENVISKHLNSAEVVVYGVEIPGEEGKAGMAAIKCDDGKDSHIDMSVLGGKLMSELPAYSMPLFVRFVKMIEHTGTFKAKKMRLVEQAFNITAFDSQLEPTFYFDIKEKCYKELTIKIYQNIINGNMRF
jgi:solute carrier family 27 fatty acid transporter 1/4